MPGTAKIQKNQKEHTKKTKKTLKNRRWGSNPKNNETEIGGRVIDRIVSKRTFEPFLKPTIGAEFFVFRRPGDEIEGIIGQPIVNYQRNTSYPIKLDDGRTVEIFGNRLLHRIIQKNELEHSRVRIVYIGREQTGYGKHSRKIYRVYKVTGRGILAPKNYDQKN